MYQSAHAGPCRGNKRPQVHGLAHRLAHGLAHGLVHSWSSRTGTHAGHAHSWSSRTGTRTGTRTGSRTELELALASGAGGEPGKVYTLSFSRDTG